MAVRIRQVRPEDYTAAAEVTVAAYAAEYGADLGYYGEHLADIAGRARNATVLVALLGETIAATVTYVDDATSPLAWLQRPDEASMRMLAVAPGYRRQGIARALTLECIQRAREDGKRAVMLHADAIMRSARALYESLGFERQPARDVAADPETWLVAYALTLATG